MLNIKPTSLVGTLVAQEEDSNSTIAIATRDQNKFAKRTFTDLQISWEDPLGIEALIFRNFEGSFLEKMKHEVNWWKEQYIEDFVVVDKIHRCIFHILSTMINEHRMNFFLEWGFLAFLDSQELEFGDSFPSTIMNAIYSASIHIAIFSKRL
ncbi:hypothetical protein SUGI_0423320 [Cryptomeria japonica]|nr:hypothetical protein SUGI_0423320 [Cryptomeria japonica]